MKIWLKKSSWPFFSRRLCKQSATKQVTFLFFFQPPSNRGWLYYHKWHGKKKNFCFEKLSVLAIFFSTFAQFLSFPNCNLLFWGRFRNFHNNCYCQEGKFSEIIFPSELCFDAFFLFPHYSTFLFNRFFFETYDIIIAF